MKHQTMLNKYWENMGLSYSRTWNSQGKSFLSEGELLIIKRSLNSTGKKKLRVLDIGFGTGRIMDYLVSDPRVLEVYGIDLSKAMRNGAKKRFAGVNKIKQLKVGDVSRQIPFRDNFFDIVTAIRVLKYNENWKQIIDDISRVLKKEGIMVFDMPNRFSINRLMPFIAPSVAKIYWSSKKDIETTLQEKSIKLTRVTGGSILPDYFYSKVNSNKGVRILEFIETLLKKIFGNILLSRFIYVVGKKN